MFSYRIAIIHKTLLICPINSVGEINSSCTITKANDLNGQTTLHLGSSPFNPTIANNTLFIPNSNSNTISACPLNSDGTLGVCVVSNIAQGTSNPAAIFVR